VDRLRPNDVHLWSIPLDANPDRALHLLTTLSPEERRHAARFRFEIHWRRYVVAHGVMRLLLGKYTGFSPQSVPLAHTEKGKPYLLDGSAEHSLRFSLTHSADLAIVAMALSQEIGVDLERIDPTTEILAIAERFFSPSESAELRDAPERERLSRFFSIWTCKEAYAKARDDRTLERLGTFTVSFRTLSHAVALSDCVDRSAPDRWSVYALDVPEGYAGALAVEGASHRILMKRWLHVEKP
jgi:4'-phosphopantetheinyl transferase